eukprot:TRINITY_DN80724_c0_g1_i1.p1 TRINITY_DN80724_c0_g1~~TRINITY_DN80724_c0_g1_i1.p1  ORF type:complete len:431 (-),score=64.63 TRINITY_DN80724_c0_g1_i1:68-1360(-)
MAAFALPGGILEPSLNRADVARRTAATAAAPVSDALRAKAAASGSFTGGSIKGCARSGVSASVALSVAALSAKRRRSSLTGKERSFLPVCRQSTEHYEDLDTKKKRSQMQIIVRILSGFVVGGLCGSATFAGGAPYMVYMTTVTLLISYEYCLLLGLMLKPKLRQTLQWSLTAISLATLWAAHLGVVTGIFECGSISMLVMLLVLQVSVRTDDGSMPIKFPHICAQVFGVFFCGYLPSFWVRLRGIRLALPTEPSSALAAVLGFVHWPLRSTVGACAATSTALCIIAADVCAWAGGRKFGRRSFTVISPKKTIEGAFFGFVGSISMALLMNAAWGGPLPKLLACFVGALIFFASVLGDLTVSAMKRDAAVKDAGSLIPGHGGVLDRFDSYFFASPLVYFFLYLLLRSQGLPATQLVGVAWSGWVGGHLQV